MFSRYIAGLQSFIASIYRMTCVPQLNHRITMFYSFYLVYEMCSPLNHRMTMFYSIDLSYNMCFLATALSQDYVVQQLCTMHHIAEIDLCRNKTINTSHGDNSAQSSDQLLPIWWAAFSEFPPQPAPGAANPWHWQIDTDARNVVLKPVHEINF